MKRMGLPVSRLSGHCGSPAHTGWPPNLVTRSVMGWVAAENWILACLGMVGLAMECGEGLLLLAWSERIRIVSASVYRPRADYASPGNRNTAPRNTLHQWLSPRNTPRS